MALYHSNLAILLLLSLLTGGHVSLFELVSFEDGTRPEVFLEENANSDDAEESSELLLVAMIEPNFDLRNHAGFHFVADNVNHLVGWLFVNDHAIRAPPLG